MIESDILSCHPELTGRSINKIKQLMAIIATSSPFTVELTKLADAIGIKDQKVLKNYLYNLDRIGAINAIYKQGSQISRLRKPEKLFLENTNYAYALTGDLNRTDIESFSVISLQTSKIFSCPYTIVAPSVISC